MPNLRKIGAKCYLAILAIPVLLVCAFLALRKEPPIRELSTLHIQSDYATADSLEALVNQAEYIVAGRYIAFDSSWNMARDAQNPAEDDADSYTEGRLYRFQVDRVIAGDLAPGEILVNLRYGQTLTVQESNAVTDETGRVTREATQRRTLSLSVLDPLYIEPQLGKPYLLFLNRGARTGNYFGAAEPFAILSDDGQARLQSNLLSQTVFSEQVALDGGRSIEVTTHVPALADFVGESDFDDVLERVIAVCEAAP